MLHFVGEKRHGGEDDDTLFVLSLPPGHSTVPAVGKPSTRRRHTPLLSPIASELADRMSQTTRPLSDPVSQSRPLVSVCILCYPYLSTCITLRSSRFFAAARVFSDSLRLHAFPRRYPEPRRHYSPFLPHLRPMEHQKDGILDSDEQSE